MNIIADTTRVPIPLTDLIAMSFSVTTIVTHSNEYLGTIKIAAPQREAEVFNWAAAYNGTHWSILRPSQFVNSGTTTFAVKKFIMGRLAREFPTPGIYKPAEEILVVARSPELPIQTPKPARVPVIDTSADSSELVAEVIRLTSQATGVPESDIQNYNCTDPFTDCARLIAATILKKDHWQSSIILKKEFGFHSEQIVNMVPRRLRGLCNSSPQIEDCVSCIRMAFSAKKDIPKVKRGMLKAVWAPESAAPVVTVPPESPRRAKGDKKQDVSSAPTPRVEEEKKTSYMPLGHIPQPGKTGILAFKDENAQGYIAYSFFRLCDDGEADEFGLKKKIARILGITLAEFNDLVDPIMLRMGNDDLKIRTFVDEARKLKIL